MAETLKSVISYFPFKGGIVRVAVILIAAVLHAVRAIQPIQDSAFKEEKKKKEKNPKTTNKQVSHIPDA